MPVDFTRERVEALAALASLELRADEIEVFARQLNDILAYVYELRQLETSGVPPTAYVAAAGETDRADDVQPCLARDEALANAPDAAIAAGLFKVPRVIG